MEGVYCVCWYKNIISLERETITSEPLITKLAHQPLLFFTVGKTGLSREIQSNS